MVSNLVFFFLPVLNRYNAPYPDEVYTQWRYTREILEKVSESGIQGEKFIWVILLIVLPLVLSTVMGIVGIAGGARQRVSAIGAIVVMVCNIGFYMKAELFWPAGWEDEQQMYGVQYIKGYGIYWILAMAVVIGCFGILGLIFTPKRIKTAAADVIPQLDEIRQEQMKPKWEFVDERVPSVREHVTQMPDAGNTPGIISGNAMGAASAPRGALVGLSGIYQGAEIPFRDGETIKFGRDAGNDVVFANSPRVSRFHCAITWFAQEGHYRILDKSSNGCFINGMEECIPQNIAIDIQVGTILDIGDANNRFRLE